MVGRENEPCLYQIRRVVGLLLRHHSNLNELNSKLLRAGVSDPMGWNITRYGLKGRGHGAREADVVINLSCNAPSAKYHCVSTQSATVSSIFTVSLLEFVFLLGFIFIFSV